MRVCRKMATLDQDIAKLKENIRRYHMDYITASPELKERLLETISSSLTLLNLYEKKAHDRDSHPIANFEDLLRRGMGDFNPRVVARARKRFSSHVVLAMVEKNVDSAVQVYEQTLILPQTDTEALLKAEGYLLQGGWQSGNDKLTICYKGLVVRLLKALTPTEFARASTLFAVLKENADVNPFLTSFEFKSYGRKNFMIMPFYSGTLESVPEWSVEDGVCMFRQVGCAIHYLHSLNFNHMDIKSSNICIRASPGSGEFVLVDLGSVVRKLEMSESTVAYVPRDFQPRDKSTPNSTYKAVDVNDWLMLGMTIAEKVYGLKIGGRVLPPTVEGLTSILERDGAFGELIALFKQV